MKFLNVKRELEIKANDKEQNSSRNLPSGSNLER